MRPILPGARGPAVEDIQRRLLQLGYQLGPTGVDGVFLGHTRDAVLAFQSQLGLSEDGTVGDETWSALVDETFTLGDRTLYLRLPHFHGRDVLLAQQALSTLGFSCGEIDGIFGAFTERAVREFQRNSGIPADGILGVSTIGALLALRHVWEGKDPRVPEGGSAGASVSFGRLAGLRARVSGAGSSGTALAERMVNLAHASAPGCAVRLASDIEAPVDAPSILIVEPGCAPEGMPVVAIGEDDESAFVARAVATLGTAAHETVAFEVPQGSDPLDSEVAQRLAVRLLDALCVALA